MLDRIYRAVGKLIFAAGVLACLAASAPPRFPPLTGRVVDEAGLLSEQTRASLERQLARHEAATSEQVVVAFLSSLRGYPIEEYGVQLARHWGIGKAKQNNGVVLIVAPNEHEVRIEVGYGLEGELTDALSYTIIQNEMLPYFRQENYAAGIVRGTQAILAVLDGAYTPAPVDKSNERPVFAFPFFLLLMLIIFLRLARGGHRGFGGYWGGGFGGGGFSRGGGGSFGGGGASGRW